jgi:hypothetical protein
VEEDDGLTRRPWSRRQRENGQGPAVGCSHLRTLDGRRRTTIIERFTMERVQQAPDDLWCSRSKRRRESPGGVLKGRATNV